MFGRWPLPVATLARASGLAPREFHFTSSPLTRCCGINAHAEQQRGYSHTGAGWSLPKVQYTKYRIAKPWTPDTTFDDLLLSEPSKDDFVKFTKELPVFLRFLKLVTDVEDRSKAFIDFAKRCENGLVVEKDVFITKSELMDCAWRNGYSTNELNAFEIAFSSDYRFHYPELAVLFNLSEEDCYKYCIRQRANTPEKLVELKYEKPKNLISSYGLGFLGVWFGLSNQVLSNAWFYSKTFPFGAVFYMLASYFQRNIREFMWKEERSLVETAKENKFAGEELVYNQMKKYASDASCLNDLGTFKNDVQKQFVQYYASLISQMRHQMEERVVGKLTAIYQAEKAIQGSLQEVMVREIVESYKQKFLTEAKQQELAFSSALQGITSDSSVMDPIGSHFITSLKELSEADLAAIRPQSGGSVVERVASVFQKREKEFLDSFTVRHEEAQEVQRILAKCRAGQGFDFTKLSAADAERLEVLYGVINGRVGFEPASIVSMEQLTSFAEDGAPLVRDINNQVRIIREKIRTARLNSFAQSFASPA